MKLVAIDGGGTKTEFVCFDEHGTVLRRACDIGCNPVDIGWGDTERVVAGVFSRLCTGCEKCKRKPDAVYAGISGGSVGGNRERFLELLHKIFPSVEAISCGSDLVSALSSGVGQKDGCVVISGTGASGMARRKGEIIRVGGWGYLLDKGGSGFDFGRDALYYALCAADGRGEKTLLTSLLEQRLQMSVTQAVPELYKNAKPAIANLAPLVFTALRAGDSVAQRILRENMCELAKLLNALSAQMQQPCHTVLAGSMFKDFNWMRPCLQEYLQGEHVFIFPKLPPVYGSAIEAAALLHIATNDAFEDEFSQSYLISCQTN